MPSDPQLPTDWLRFAALLPHAQAALPPGSSALGRIASFLGYSGNYPAARLMQQQVVEARAQSLGAEHPDTLAARGNLAYWTGMAGDAATARDQFAAVLPITERVRGTEHPHTLTTRANLHSWARRASE